MFSENSYSKNNKVQSQCFKGTGTLCTLYVSDILSIEKGKEKKNFGYSTCEVKTGFYALFALIYLPTWASIFV